MYQSILVHMVHSVRSICVISANFAKKTDEKTPDRAYYH